MFRSFLTTALLGAGVLVFAAGPANAQKHGGGGHSSHGSSHGGSVHSGSSSRGGSVHPGTVHSGGTVYGGYGGYGGYRSGYYPYRNYSGFGFGFGYPWYAPFDDYYNGYRYGYSSLYPPYSYTNPPIWYDDYPDYGGTYRLPPPPPAPVQDTQAHLQVIVPDAGAQVWVDGYKTSSTGPTRMFDSPPLEPGKSFSYQVKATWRQDGDTVTAERTVSVLPGSTSVVDFTKAANPAKE